MRFEATKTLFSSTESEAFAQSEPIQELSPVEAKKIAQTEKKKARILKDIDKKISTVEKKLKLREDQHETVHSYLIPYYVKRHSFAANLKTAQGEEQKKKARQALRRWGNQLKIRLSATLDEKQLKTGEASRLDP